MDSERQSYFHSPGKSRTVNRWSKHDRYFLQLIKLHASSEVLRRWEILVVFPLPSVCPRVVPQILGEQMSDSGTVGRVSHAFWRQTKAEIWDFQALTPRWCSTAHSWSWGARFHHVCFQVVHDLSSIFCWGFSPKKNHPPTGPQRPPPPTHGSPPPRIVRSFHRRQVSRWSKALRQLRSRWWGCSSGGLNRHEQGTCCFNSYPLVN